MIHSYFDVDDIGTDEEPVPVTFTVPSFRLGSDVVVRAPDGEPAGEITPGCTATLPLWAAAALRRHGFAAVHLPPKFALATFREFKTDPLAPSLFLKSPHFYEAGLVVCTLLGNPSSTGNLSPEGNRLAAQIFRLYQLRYLKILLAAAKKGFDLSDVKEKLTESERELLNAFLTGMEEEKRWLGSPI